MNTRVGLIIAASISLVLGADIWINKGGSLYRQPVSQVAGIVLIIFGLFLLIFCVVKPQSVTSKKYICPKCEEIVERSGKEEVLCPKCGTKMEPLKGFYERHPGLNEKSENNAV